MANARNRDGAGGDSYSVRVVRMGSGDHGERVDGFASGESAREYARRRTRASIEQLHQTATRASELRCQWSASGEDCCVTNDSYCGSSELEGFIATSASGYECDWWSMDPTLPRRYFIRAFVEDDDGHSAWLELFPTAFTEPTDQDVLELCAEEAAAEFARQGHADVRATKATITSVFRLPSIPRPTAAKSCPHWRIDLDFHCGDVKFGGRASGVFAWPRQPAGAFLDNFMWLLIDDTLSVRGEGPGFAPWSDIGYRKVEMTNEPLTHAPTPDY